MDPGTRAKYAYNGKVMLGSAVVIFLIIIVLMVFNTYGDRCCRSRRRPRRRRQQIISRDVRTAAAVTIYTDNASPINMGLEPPILRSLPTFIYTSVTQRPLQDCAVCLSEFEENDEGRLLPYCNHAFHSSCIDTWFSSHSTCPLCRAPVLQPNNRRLSECETDPAKEDGASSSSSLPAPIGCPRTPLEVLDVIVDIPVEEDERVRLSESAHGPKNSDNRTLSLRRFWSF